MTGEGTVNRHNIIVYVNELPERNEVLLAVKFEVNREYNIIYTDKKIPLIRLDHHNPNTKRYPQPYNTRNNIIIPL